MDVPQPHDQQPTTETPTLNQDAKTIKEGSYSQTYETTSGDKVEALNADRTNDPEFTQLFQLIRSAQGHKTDVKEGFLCATTPAELSNQGIELPDNTRALDELSQHQENGEDIDTLRILDQPRQLGDLELKQRLASRAEDQAVTDVYVATDGNIVEMVPTDLLEDENFLAPWENARKAAGHDVREIDGQIHVVYPKNTASIDNHAVIQEAIHPSDSDIDANQEELIDLAKEIIPQ